MPLFFFLYLGLCLSFTSFGSCVASSHEIAHRKLSNAACPLDIDAFRKIIREADQPILLLDVQTECQFMLEGIRLLRSEYLRTTGYFSPPSNASEACWHAYESLNNESLPGFGVRSTCGFKASLMTGSCMNITTRSQFESLISQSELQGIQDSCNQSLENNSTCDSCKQRLWRVSASNFGRPVDGNESDCNSYPFMYAAAFASRYGPTNLGTVKCLFSLDFNAFNVNTKRIKHTKVMRWAVLVGCVSGFFVAVLVVWVLWRRHKKYRGRKRNMELTEMGFASAMEIIGENTSLVKFPFEEIKKATKNFSRENIIGMGGYGNVYKGILADGSEVALKRFKNFSAGGDEAFAHEVEVIASIRHVNLVTVRGYCTVAVPLHGHQKIIVCELVHNGSLYDHLFDSRMKKLSWPIRQKIASGIARGLAYLHYGVEPAIIHRDVKASNILLDQTFEPKLADFGFAKFTPEGFTHLSTRVAGTLGYVAPEYAMYGQLSERSDVYSFGVVLLELLSGKKAVVEADGTGTLLLADWAWSQVREGNPLDVVDENMPELGFAEVMERHVLVAALCSHPVAYARPTMDQVVKMLESDFPLPSIPDCPLVDEMVKIDQPASFSGSSYISSPEGQQPCCYESDHPILCDLEKVGSSQKHM